MLTVMADGETLAERFGSGPAQVIALHGWRRTGADFDAVLEGFDGLAVQLRGFGGAEPPPEAWGTEEYAEALARALDPSSPVIVVGHSFGGRIAVRLAARHPELVRGLVLTGAPLVRVQEYRPRTAFRIVRWLAGHGLLPQRVLDRARERYGSEDYRTASGVMREVFSRIVRDDYRDDLARIVAPTRFVWGEHDDSALPEGGRAAAGMVRDGAFRIVPGAGHLLDERLVTAIRAEIEALLAAVP